MRLDSLADKTADKESCRAGSGTWPGSLSRRRGTSGSRCRRELPLSAGLAVLYPGIVKALASMPDETVIDGEVAALDPKG